MPKSHIKILDTVVFGIPRSASNSTLAIADLCWLQPVQVQHSQVFCLFWGLPEQKSLSTDSQPSLKRLCHTFICTALTASFPKAFWVIWIVSTEECSSLTQNLMQICCSTCSVILNIRTVCMLTQGLLPPPLTSTVKPSLFIHVYFSLLSLADR